MYSAPRAPHYAFPFAVVLASISLFLVDLWLPLGFAAGVLYVIPVVATAWARSEAAAQVIALLCTILLLIGAAFSPLGAPASVYLTNRALSILAIWACAVLVVRLGRTESARAESTLQFHELGENLPEAFWLTSPHEERCEYVNPAFERIWGLPRQALLANPRGWRDAVHAEDLAAVDRTLDRVRAAHAVEVEYRILRPDASLRWISDRTYPLCNSSGTSSGLAHLCRDITERKFAADARAATNELLRTTLDSLSAHIALLDKSGLILEVNEAWRRFGREHGLAHPNGGVGANYFEVCRAATDDGVEEARYLLEKYESLSSGAIDEFSTEYECHTGTTQLWFTVRMTRYAADGPARFVVAHEDVTARKRAEALAGQRLRELSRADRLDALGQMASTLAHELNQPLGAIANYLHGCRLRFPEDDPLPAEVREALDGAAEEAARAGEIVKRLRNFVRHGAADRKQADLNATVTGVARLLEAHARYNGFSLTLELAPAPLPVLVDEVQVQQVIVNLVNNAIDAMNEAGVENGAVTITTVRSGDAHVEIMVADNGPGIPADQLDSVFQPFHSTKSGGLGLGLAITRAIVEAHEGQLWATSTELAGTTFHIRLPSLEETNADEVKAESVRG